MTKYLEIFKEKGDSWLKEKFEKFFNVRFDSRDAVYFLPRKNTKLLLLAHDQYDVFRFSGLSYQAIYLEDLINQHTENLEFIGNDVLEFNKYINGTHYTFYVSSSGEFVATLKLYLKGEHKPFGRIFYIHNQKKWYWRIEAGRHTTMFEIKNIKYMLNNNFILPSIIELSKNDAINIEDEAIFLKELIKDDKFRYILDSLP